MHALKFTTSVNCRGCIKAVTPFRAAEKEIQRWNVDTASPDKVPTVEGENLLPEKVIQIVEKAGFKVQPVRP